MSEVRDAFLAWQSYIAKVGSPSSFYMPSPFNCRTEGCWSIGTMYILFRTNENPSFVCSVCDFSCGVDQMELMQTLQMNGLHEMPK